MEKLVRFLLGYRQGHVVPFISIYGRSGSGKTTIVQQVIKELDEFDHIFVNLRKAGTIFAATNLILEKLGQETVRGSNSTKSPAFDRINFSISLRLEKNPKRLFIMVLDEFDTIFNDPRGRPSDFIYKLIELGNDLSKKGFMFTVIGISNDVLAEYDIEDRVKSRIGTSEIFFSPYHHGNVLTILEERAKEAFALKIDDSVLEHCAKLASEDHGDARRAIDLLRAAAESASAAGQPIDVSHVDWAARELYKDRLENILTESSYNFRRVLASLARVTYLSKQEWHFTSTIAQQYKKVWQNKAPPFSYRRISETLNEMEGMGVITSHATSQGRHGYGKQYKLEMDLNMVGRTLDINWWNGIKKGEKLHASLIKSYKKAGDISEKQKNRTAKNEAVDAAEKHYDNFIWQDEDDDESDLNNPFVT